MEEEEEEEEDDRGAGLLYPSALQRICMAKEDAFMIVTDEIHQNTIEAS